MKPRSVPPVWSLAVPMACVLAAFTPPVWGRQTASAANAPARSETPTPLAIVSRAAHQRVLELTTQETGEDGVARPVTHQIVELATGLHYLDETGEWAESVEAFELVPGSARAWKGPHRITLASNPNTPAAVQHRLPDGRLLSSHVFGVGWYDTATGESVLLAQVADTTGVLVEDNVVLYPDALQGKVTCDLRYTYTRSGFEQDVVLRDAPPPPESFGLSPTTSRLEVWTEFDEPLEPAVKAVGKAAAAAASDPAADVELDFGSMKIGTGRFFRLGGEEQTLGLMVKEWIREQDGRQFLVEAVAYGQVEGSLKDLPASEGGASVRPAGKRAQVWAGIRKGKPAVEQQVRMQRLDRSRDTALVARLGRPGLVLDYISLTTGAANYVFRSDIMYWVSGTVTLSGTTRFEPGACVKFSTASNAQIDITGPVVWLANPLMPVTLTARDDAGFGMTAPGQTTPLAQAGYGGSGLRFNGPSGTVISGLRVRNLRQGVEYATGTGHVLRHAQFVNVGEAVRLRNGTSVTVGNALVHRASTGVFGGTGSATAVAEHLTVNQANRLAVSGVFASSAALTVRNSILVSMTNNPAGTYTGGSHNHVSTTADVTFASLRGGGHYLPVGSAHLDMGTASVDSTLTTQLREMTTEVPRELVGEIAFNRVLFPVVAMDLGTLDRGYHYPRIDYAVSGASLTNATLTLTNGVRVAAYGSSGIDLRAGAVLRSGGSPNRMNWLTRLALLQESTTAETNCLWLRPFSGAPTPRVEMRFTGFGAAAESFGRRHLLETNSVNPAVWSMRDCALWNVYYLSAIPNSGHVFDWSNNRLHRCYVELNQGPGPGYTVNLFNNLWTVGTLILSSGASSSQMTLRDNLFEVTANTSGGSAAKTASDNGYRSATAFVGAGNVTITVSEHLTGPLGTNYYPSAGGASGGFTNLLGAGFRTGTAAGLFHHVIATNLVPVGANLVGIGFHHLRTSTAGVPFDTDGDGIPDWMEDVNGDGVHQTASESDWATSSNGTTSSAGLQVFTRFE